MGKLFVLLSQCIAALLFGGIVHGEPAVGSITQNDAAVIGTEAYIYGYPLVTMEVTRRVMTNVATAGSYHAPMGQFYHARTYPDASFRDVTTPNADTLYSTAWIDVSGEPYVLNIPDAGGRYFLVPLLNGWTTVFESLGTRTTGSSAQRYLITGPGWSGTVPEGLKECKSSTGLVWIIGRTYSSGAPEDLAKVHALQDRYELMPLSAYGKPYAPAQGTVDPSVDMKTPVRDQVNRLDAQTFFQLLASVMEKNPPAAEDAAIVERMALIGVVPGRPFELSRIEPAVAKALQEVPAVAQQKILAHQKEAGVQVNGWTFSLKTGIYGTDYLQRAFIAAVGLGANRPEDAVYPMSQVDAEGKPYDGINRYVIHFNKEEIPPVNGFWSLTMYDEQFFFTPNRLNRFAVSPRSDLVYNADGSLDLYVQNESPGPDKESNWLPAPAGRFVLTMRLYWPKEEVLERRWQPAPLRLSGPRREPDTEG